MINTISVERDVVRQCLNELDIINGYIIHDFSIFWNTTLDRGVINVALVSELVVRECNIYVV